MKAKQTDIASFFGGKPKAPAKPAAAAAAATQSGGGDAPAAAQKPKRADVSRVAATAVHGV